MIKFFKTIRRKILAEGKFRKYMLYAIGEIALVVIGILLALSINEWNQNIKNLEKTEIYLERIVADIALDTTTMKTYIESQKQQEQRFENYFKFIKQGNVTLEQLKDTLDRFQTFTGFVEFTSTTYDQLVASGNFELIDEDKRIAIINYYKFCNVFMERVASFENSMKNESVEASKYLDIESTDYEFFKAINQMPSVSFISQGLKHRHNRIGLGQKKWNLIKILNKTYMEVAQSTIQSLKHE